MRTPRMCLFAIFAWSLFSHAQALTPILYSDPVLAQSSVVVIGYWVPHTKRTVRKQIERNVVRRYEVHTELIVTKVLHGEVKPGKHELVCQGFADWQEDGSRLTSASSALDVTDTNVSKPNIWFLKKSRSWDKKDVREYLTLRTYQFIQPTYLLRYFQIMRSPRRNLLVSECLISRNPHVVEKALSFIAGQITPWPQISLRVFWEPNGHGEPYGYKKVGRLPRHAATVREVVKRSPSQNRPYALALYSEMVGYNAVPTLRHYLNDKDPMLQGTAAGFLIRFKVRFSLQKLGQICRKVQDSELGHELALVMEKSRNLEFVPPLIELLDATADGGWSADKNGVHHSAAVFKAHEALLSLTSFTFPFDSRRSMEAWKKVSKMERKYWVPELEKRLGNWQRPLEIQIQPVADENGMRKRVSSREKRMATLARAQIKNLTKAVIVLQRYPSYISQWSDQDVFSVDPEVVSDAPGFIDLKPGQSHTFLFKVDDEIFRSPLAPKIYVSYLEKGKAPGWPWVGVLLAKISSSPIPMKPRVLNPR